MAIRRRSTTRTAVLSAIVAAVLALATMVGASAASAEQTEATTMVAVERTSDGGLRVETFEVAAGAYHSAFSDPDVLSVEPIGTVQAFADEESERGLPGSAQRCRRRHRPDPRSLGNRWSSARCG